MKSLATFVFVTALVALSATHASAMVPEHVPDVASTAALLGAGILGLFGVRRFLSKR